MVSIIGQKLGGFEILSEAGRGAMGVVYRARQIEMDRIVAIKFLPKRLAKKKKFVERFLREARAAGQLNHPNIITVHDTGTARGLHYIAMEFVDGLSARLEINENGPYDEKRVIEIGIQMAAALKAAHHKGILHRDIKPDNVLINKEGNALLADLGLALQENRDQEDNRGKIGTPHFMSPEQAKGQPADARSDLYSLGATLFVMATGKTLYEGKATEEILKKVINEEPRSLKTLVPKLTPGLVSVVEKLIKKDPDERYQDGGSVERALKALLAPPMDMPVILGLASNESGSRPGRRSIVRRKEDSAGSIKSLVPFLIIGLVVILVFTFMGRSGSARSSTRERKPAGSSTPLPFNQNALDDYQKLVKQDGQLLRYNPKKCAADWVAFLKQYPKTFKASLARNKMNRARERAEQIQEDFEGAQKNIMDMRESPNLKLAIKIVHNFEKAYVQTHQAKSLVKQFEKIKRAREAFANNHLEKAQTALRANDYNRARMLLNAPTKFEDLPASFYKEREQVLAEIDQQAANDKKQADTLKSERNQMAIALERAFSYIRGPTKHFDFTNAHRAYLQSSSGIKTAKMKKEADLWDQRIMRMRNMWRRLKERLKKKVDVEVGSMGTYDKGCHVVGIRKEGLIVNPKNFPPNQPQTAFWRTIKAEQIVLLIQGLELIKSPQDQLDAGLLALGVGASERSSVLLQKARKTKRLRALADGAMSQLSNH